MIGASMISIRARQVLRRATPGPMNRAPASQNFMLEANKYGPKAGTASRSGTLRAAWCPKLVWEIEKIFAMRGRGQKRRAIGPEPAPMKEHRRLAGSEKIFRFEPENLQIACKR